MIRKHLLRTKTFWAGFASVLVGIGMCVSGEVETGSQTILGGLTAMFIRDAINTTAK